MSQGPDEIILALIGSSLCFYVLMLLGMDMPELLWVLPKPQADAMKAAIY
jgi:hypothetical protein